MRVHRAATQLRVHLTSERLRRRHERGARQDPLARAAAAWLNKAERYVPGGFTGTAVGSVGGAVVAEPGAAGAPGSLVVGEAGTLAGAGTLPGAGAG